ncbi:Pre-SET domain-containing protein [Cynara cardunculus var. scolymus]|uniref:Pre-SET domain-containing protein n=1 Tax=Cynara cardunculus var. scolymus TaxID=59895 RepID=A0A103XHV5_CYNCS|nr:Pre-SET domain-containing protein [Cynara cardunculus var. scolymus]
MAPSGVTWKRTAKACKAMKPFGISGEIVKSTLKRLLEAYEKNWTYIEEDNYRVLIEAIFEPEVPKVLKQDKFGTFLSCMKTMDTTKIDFHLRDESEEESEPLKKKARLGSQSRSSSPAGTSIPCLSKYASEMQQMVEPDSGIIDIYPPGRSCENDSLPKSLVEGNKSSALAYNNLDNKGNENENVSPCSSEIEIASFFNGEVKLSFSICKPPPIFCIPSLEAVMKQVEDRYRELFQGLGTEFSLFGLLQDICASFMEQWNASEGNKQNRSPTFDNLKEPEKQVDQSGLSNRLVAHTNPIDGPIQIPRAVVSSAFNHLHCVKVLHSDGNYFSGRLRELQMLDIDEFSGSSSLTIFPKENSSVYLCSNHHSVADITRGLEKQEISLINEFNDEMLPAFTYIPKNVNYKTANVNFMLSRVSDGNCFSNCFGDCLYPEVPCDCAAETGGEVAYTTEGLVKKKFLKRYTSISLNPKKMNYFYCDNCPLERMTKRAQSGSCRGHLVRKFIKECWYKCGCVLNCGNRVVQIGIKAKLQRNEQNKDEKHTYPVVLDANWSSEGFLKNEEALCLDATSFGNVARFINHMLFLLPLCHILLLEVCLIGRCVDANMVEIPVEVESPDHHYYHVMLLYL